jgi:hypothetical protein
MINRKCVKSCAAVQSHPSGSLICLPTFYANHSLTEIYVMQFSTKDAAEKLPRAMDDKRASIVLVDKRRLQADHSFILSDCVARQTM